MRILNLVAGAVMALGLLSAAVSAATVEYKTYISGVDLGTSPIAKLEAKQVGNDVLFTLTNNMTGPTRSFLSKLYLTFAGDRRPVSRENVSGVASSRFFKGAKFGALEYQLQLTWRGADRLNGGESATFRLLNLALDDLFQGDDFSRVLIRGLPRGTTSSYAGTLVPAPVPVPAAGLLLLGALGGLAVMRRRKAA